MFDLSYIEKSVDANLLTTQVAQSPIGSIRNWKSTVATSVGEQVSLKVSFDGNCDY